jgi:teichuronic acid biosynthesis glycosyltransferase TuaC
MRICLYTETAPPALGGQALVVDALARQLIALGHEAVVLAPQQRHAGDLDHEALPYRLVHHPRFYSTRWFVERYAYWLARLQHKHAFQLVHCHSTYPNGYVAASCAAIAGIPLVITSHGSDLDPLSLLCRKPQLRDRYLLALRRADALIAVSGATENWFRQAEPALRRLERIPNGVDLARFAADVARPVGLDPAIRAGEYVLFLGRIEPRKGADLLLEAFAATAQGHQTTLVIAGDGKDRSALQTRAADAGLADRIRLPGRVEGDAKTWLLRHSLCSVIPSRVSEGFPLSLLESYAAGRPVIGTRIPGLRELIQPRRTGWLVPADSVADLAQALAAAISDRNATDVMGTQARRAIQAYDWKTIARRHVALFAELIGQRSARKAA